MTGGRVAETLSFHLMYRPNANDVIGAIVRVDTHDIARQFEGAINCPEKTLKSLTRTDYKHKAHKSECVSEPRECLHRRHVFSKNKLNAFGL